MATKPAAKKAPAKKAARPSAAKPKSVNPVPPGLSTLTVNLVLRDCAKAIAFYKKAFQAKELTRALAPDGKSVWHCTLQIGESIFFVNDPDPENPYREPAGQLWLYGPEVDARYQRAVKAGAKPVMPLWDAFWGDRMGMVVDPFGQTWTLAMHVRDVTPAEAKKAGDAFAKSQGS